MHAMTDAWSSGFMLTTAALLVVAIEACALYMAGQRRRQRYTDTHVSRKTLDKLNGRIK